MEGGGPNNKLVTMRFTHNDVNFDVKYGSHQNWSKTYFMSILRIFDDHIDIFWALQVTTSYDIFTITQELMEKDYVSLNSLYNDTQD